MAWIRKFGRRGDRETRMTAADDKRGKETREMIRGRDGKLRPVPRTIQKRGL